MLTFYRFAQAARCPTAFSYTRIPSTSLMAWTHAYARNPPRPLPGATSVVPKSDYAILLGPSQPKEDDSQLLGLSNRRKLVPHSKPRRFSPVMHAMASPVSIYPCRPIPRLVSFTASCTPRSTFGRATQACVIVTNSQMCSTTDAPRVQLFRSRLGLACRFRCLLAAVKLVQTLLSTTLPQPATAKQNQCICSHG